METLNKYIEVIKERMESPRYEISFTEGKKYWKVIYKSSYGNQKSVHSFVEKSTGNILKAATWNAPAKGIRGNINDADNGRSAIGDYGARYLK